MNIRISNIFDKFAFGGIVPQPKPNAKLSFSKFDYGLYCIPYESLPSLHPLQSFRG